MRRSLDPRIIQHRASVHQWIVDADIDVEVERETSWHGECTRMLPTIKRPLPSLLLLALPPELLGHIAMHLGPAGLLACSRAGDTAMRRACAESVRRLLCTGSALSLGGFTPTQRLVLLARAEVTADRALDESSLDELHAIARTWWIGRLVRRVWTSSWLTKHAELIAALVLARWCDLEEERVGPQMCKRPQLAAVWQTLKATSSSNRMRIQALALKHDRVSADTVCAGMHDITLDIHDATDCRRQRAVEAGALEAVVAALGTHPQVVAVQLSGALVLAYICDVTVTVGSCARHTNRRQRAVEAGALETLVAASRAHPQEAALQYYACYAIASICTGLDCAADSLDGRKQRASEAGALEVAVAALWTHLEDTCDDEEDLRRLRSDLRHQCMWVLSDVCDGMDAASNNSRVQRAVEAGAVEAVVASMKAHERDLGLHDQGIWVMSKICGGEDTKVTDRRRRAVEVGALEEWWS